MRRAGIAALLLLVAHGASATDLELGVEASVQYDDNLLSSSEDELDDFSLRLTPRLRLFDDRGKLSWEVRYFPRYRKFLESGEFDGWDQDVYGRLTWKPTERTKLEISDWYTDLASFDRLLTEEVLQDGTIDTGFDLGQQRSSLNRLNVALSHALTRRSTIELGITRDDTKYEEPGNSNTEVTTGSLSYLYGWDMNNQVGLVGRFTRQTVEPFAADAVALDTDYYNLSLQWLHSFDPTLYFSILVGPTWVEAEQTPFPNTLRNRPLFPLVSNVFGITGPVSVPSCPLLEGTGEPILASSCTLIPQIFFTDTEFLSEVGDIRLRGPSNNVTTDLTYFATASLVKQWTNYSVTFRYLRDVSTSSNVSGVIRDVVSVVGIWDPTEQWRLQLSAFYEIREQTSTNRFPVVILEGVTAGGIPNVGRAAGYRLVQVDGKTRSDRIFVSFYAQYDVSRSTMLFANVFFSNEQFKVNDDESRETNRFGVWLGVRYTLEVFHLPI
jgi:hypothetical protein